MDKKLLDYQGVIELSNQIARAFVPNKEYGAPCRFSDPRFQPIDLIDLKIMEDNSLILLAGVHASAAYILQIKETNDGKCASIWQNDQTADGVIGKIENIVSLYPDSNLWRIERGILRRNSHFLMPYFKYERPGPELEKVRVIQPTTNWMDTAQTLRIIKP